MPSIDHRSQPLGPDMPLKPAHCSQSPSPDILSGPNIPSKPVHHCSQHSKSKSNSAAEVLVVVWAAAICELTLCLFGLADSNSLRLPPPLQPQGWKKLSSG
ncbi:hypothetical protein BDZ91DRAFT_734592 [Kalaharituber pfeilii]|nr:hypothetical protein BDZ91DRAFT_734592 [Kalaharituber pfeilii]